MKYKYLIIKYQDIVHGIMGLYDDVFDATSAAEIRIDKKKRHLGSFIDKNDAIAIRKEAEIKYGYHANHGRAV